MDEPTLGELRVWAEQDREIDIPALIDRCEAAEARAIQWTEGERASARIAELEAANAELIRMDGGAAAVVKERNALRAKVERLQAAVTAHYGALVEAAGVLLPGRGTSLSYEHVCKMVLASINEHGNPGADILQRVADTDALRAEVERLEQELENWKIDLNNTAKARDALRARLSAFQFEVAAMCDLDKTEDATPDHARKVHEQIDALRARLGEAEKLLRRVMVGPLPNEWMPQARAFLATAGAEVHWPEYVSHPDDKPPARYIDHGGAQVLVENEPGVGGLDTGAEAGKEGE